MSVETKFTILGCGSSPGVPRPNGDWGVCDYHNKKNKRTRTAFLIERIHNNQKTSVVIDTGPDFREQMIRSSVNNIDAVVYTHAHADHTHGIDDVRTFAIQKQALLDIYADEMTLSRLYQGFGYCFKTPQGSNYPPILKANKITANETFKINGAGGPISFNPFIQQHGDIHSLGFRIGDVAYCTDVNAFLDGTADKLQNLDVLIIDALQYKSHSSHFSLSEALEWISVLKPKRTFLTHMHIQLDYETVMQTTPDHVEPSFDGLSFSIFK